MTQEDSFYELISPSFWENDLTTPFSELKNMFFDCWDNFCSDLELLFKLWILIFWPKLASKFWPAQEHIRG